MSKIDTPSVLKHDALRDLRKLAACKLSGRQGQEEINEYDDKFKSNFIAWVKSHNNGNSTEKQKSFTNLLNWKKNIPYFYIDTYVALTTACDFNPDDSTFYQKVYSECINNDDYDSDSSDEGSDDSPRTVRASFFGLPVAIEMTAIRGNKKPCNQTKA